MRLHYMGKYNLDPASLPHGEHMPGAVKFREADDTGKLARIANTMAVIIMLAMAIPAAFRCGRYIVASPVQACLGFIAPVLTLFPHEFLHAVCFRDDVYIYTNLSQGMLFVVGPEPLGKARFVFMSLFPNIVFGFLPYAVGMIFPQCVFCLALGVIAAGMGAGDYYNVFNAVTQMPGGAKTYLYQFNSYWYMPQD